MKTPPIVLIGGVAVQQKKALSQYKTSDKFFLTNFTSRVIMESLQQQLLSGVDQMNEQGNWNVATVWN